VSATAARKILDIASLLHNRLMQLSATARECGQDGLARQIEDCKLDLANQITAVVLELQIDALHKDALEIEVGS
jgi:hypothetical protein